MREWLLIIMIFCSGAPGMTGWMCCRAAGTLWNGGCWTGETLACGTGCCAAAVACVLNGLTDNAVTVRLLGGELLIEWDREKNLIYMTGPAVTVFEGEIEVDVLQIMNGEL